MTTRLDQTCALRRCRRCGRRFASNDPHVRYCGDCFLDFPHLAFDDGTSWEPDWIDNPDLPCPPRLMRAGTADGWRAWLALVAGLIGFTLLLTWIYR